VSTKEWVQPAAIPRGVSPVVKRKRELHDICDVSFMPGEIKKKKLDVSTKEWVQPAAIPRGVSPVVQRKKGKKKKEKQVIPRGVSPVVRRETGHTHTTKTRSHTYTQPHELRTSNGATTA